MSCAKSCRTSFSGIWWWSANAAFGTARFRPNRETENKKPHHWPCRSLNLESYDFGVTIQFGRVPPLFTSPSDHPRNFLSARNQLKSEKGALNIHTQLLLILFTKKTHGMRLCAMCSPGATTRSLSADTGTATTLATLLAALELVVSFASLQGPWGVWGFHNKSM